MSTFPPFFIFRLRYEAKKFPDGKFVLEPELLGPDYEIPALWRFAPLSARHFSGQNKPQDDQTGGEVTPDFHFRFAWREDGVLLTLLLQGKKCPVQVNSNKYDTSDSFSLFLDTRDVRDLHRSTKFCHRLLFLPAPESGENPSALWLPIHRAKAHPNPVDITRFQLAFDRTPESWRLSAFIPGDTLTGYEPLEHSRLGISFSLFDNEFGWISQQLPDFFPVAEDPSLWASLDLVE